MRRWKILLLFDGKDVGNELLLIMAIGRFVMKKILFVASEGVPFIKTGWTGRCSRLICRSALISNILMYRVILPKYTCMKQEMKDKLTHVTHFYMDFHWKN